MPMTTLPSVADAIAQQQAALQSTQDPAAAAANQAALQNAAQQRSQYDILNFAAGVSGNSPLAQSVSALTKATQDQYTPEKLGQTGVLIPGSGQFVESPMYADEKESGRIAKTQQILAAQQAANDRAQEKFDMQRQIAEDRNQNRLLVQSMAAAAHAAAGGAAADRMSLARERFQNTKDQQDQNDVVKFGATLTKNGLPQISSAVDDINALMQKYPDGNIPGIGYGSETLSKIPFINSDEARQNRAVVQRLNNAMTLTEAGKAVTKNELVRQALVNMSGDAYSTQNFRDAMTHVILPSLENVRSNALHSTDPSIVGRYMRDDSSGYDPRKSFLPVNTKNPAATTHQVVVDPVAEALKKYQ